jgi:N-acetylglutamate synthase-like GNAT family acetyltransferase
MSGNIILRPAIRSDIPALAHIANAANAQSALHRRIALHQEQYPADYYRWRLNTIRQRFATPDLRTIVAVDATTGEILGHAAWAVEGAGTALHKRWLSECSWMCWLEGKLVQAEKTWSRYVTDRSIDYRFFQKFFVAFMGSEKHARPDCLHLHLIVVNPDTQTRGVGRMLINWGKKLAVAEELPIYLESNLEATGFYEKIGFLRLGKDCVIKLNGQEEFRIPMFAWEGEERKGHWLERDVDSDASGERWKWTEDVLSAEKSS